MALVRTHCSILLCWSLAVIGTPLLAKDSEPPAQPAASGRFSVLELPPPTTGLPDAARQRAHHALSFSTDAPKPFLRSLGLDATDCSVRLRMPSRITPSRGSSTGIAVEVQAQAGLGCRF